MFLFSFLLGKLSLLYRSGYDISLLKVITRIVKLKKETDMNIQISVKKKVPTTSENSTNYIGLIESKYTRILSEKEQPMNVGDIIRVGYLIPEGNKERTQYYEGLVIAKNNRGLGKSFTLRRNVQGIGVEQVFLFHSPKIVSVTKKQASKIRRAKLYFIRALSGKATRLKVKL